MALIQNQNLNNLNSVNSNHLGHIPNVNSTNQINQPTYYSNINQKNFPINNPHIGYKLNNNINNGNYQHIPQLNIPGNVGHLSDNLNRSTSGVINSNQQYTNNIQLNHSSIPHNLVNQHSNQEVFKGYIECLCHMYIDQKLKSKLCNFNCPIL